MFRECFLLQTLGGGKIELFTYLGKGIIPGGHLESYSPEVQDHYLISLKPQLLTQLHPDPTQHLLCAGPWRLGEEA